MAAGSEAEGECPQGATLPSTRSAHLEAWLARKLPCPVAVDGAAVVQHVDELQVVAVVGG